MNKEHISIDGSMGDGGGQVLRASLALSMALGRPFSIVNIRANRPKPGLKRQHLACVHAAQSICGATVTGDVINSTCISFVPGPVKAGDYHFDIGSGGSCTLVLQAVVPPLLLADVPSRLAVTGGTHVPYAPPFEFLRDTLFPWLEKFGPRLKAHMVSPGFMSVGGGCITVELAPATAFTPLTEGSCGGFSGAEATIMAHNLDARVAERERAALLEERFASLGLTGSCVQASVQSRSVQGPGNAVMVHVRRESGVTVCTAIGQKGIAAEVVAGKAAARALEFVYADVPVDRHLADQLLVPLALAGGGTFLTEKPTLHTETCMKIIQLFTDMKASAVQQTKTAWRISLE